jgi:hypothetical protein
MGKGLAANGAITPVPDFRQRVLARSAEFPARSRPRHRDDSNLPERRLNAKIATRFRLLLRASLCVSVALVAWSCLGFTVINLTASGRTYVLVGEGAVSFSKGPEDAQGLRASFPGEPDEQQSNTIRCWIHPSSPSLLPEVELRSFFTKQRMPGSAFRSYYASLPLVWPTLGLMACLYWFERRSRARARLPSQRVTCDQCEYSLDGLTPGATCPECGQVHRFAQPQALASPPAAETECPE